MSDRRGNEKDGREIESGGGREKESERDRDNREREGLGQ